jgi:multidrug efflux pump subunit AcrA (membrane-fusion protein)
MSVQQRWFLGATGMVLAAGLGAGAAHLWLPRVPAHPPLVHTIVVDDPSDDPQGEQAVIVKTIHPKRDRSFTVTVQQFATVEPYYQADLRARASGVVKFIPKDIGAPVQQGELLVEIDVPDLRQEVFQKEAVIQQRRNELRLARAQAKTAEAHLDVARASIEQAQTLVAQTKATRDLRESRLNRLRKLRDDINFNANVVDEEERNLLAADAEWQHAQVGVRRAQADYREKEASLEGAQADVLLKESLIEVARRDRDRTLALADYARLTAPFDGVIVRREVDLGTFVQNATSSSTEPLVSVARTDVVTVVTRLPDNVAPFVSQNTRVTVLLDELPGVAIEGRVTRFAPSVMNQDRTMRVEVDLFNGDVANYAHYLGQYFSCRLAATAAASPVEAVALGATGRDALGPRLKSISDPLPLFPHVEGGSPGATRLLPGMSGQMRVQLQKFANAFLLPSSAIFTRGGKSYILEVTNGMTQLLPVRVQVNDGRLAKVAVVARAANIRTGEAETLRELDGTEEIVASRQVELGAGHTVRAVLEDW